MAVTSRSVSCLSGPGSAAEQTIPGCCHISEAISAPETPVPKQDETLVLVLNILMARGTDGPIALLTCLEFCHMLSDSRQAVMYADGRLAKNSQAAFAQLSIHKDIYIISDILEQI